MRRAIDLAAISRPTILEVWTPSCGECKAMQSDLDEVAEEFCDRVDLKMVSAAENLETVMGWGVRATPTLIGVREGEEVFRMIGRRSRTDLYGLFEALEQGHLVRRANRRDLVVHLLAGSALVGVGLASGPVWPLVAFGSVILTNGFAFRWWARGG